MPAAATIPRPDHLDPELAALIEALALAQVRREDRAAAQAARNTMSVQER